ncbi:hypothetical protein DENSPDRAFT_693014 [Dentipellis sp. KUC8613]|nr:hypothetical protein DENSPDRAFT_693014 [Dentipellis sp. KUC8613]
MLAPLQATRSSSSSTRKDASRALWHTERRPRRMRQCAIPLPPAHRSPHSCFRRLWDQPSRRRERAQGHSRPLAPLSSLRPSLRRLHAICGLRDSSICIICAARCPVPSAHRTSTSSSSPATPAPVAAFPALLGLLEPRASTSAGPPQATRSSFVSQVRARNGRHTIPLVADTTTTTRSSDAQTRTLPLKNYPVPVRSPRERNVAHFQRVSPLVAGEIGPRARRAYGPLVCTETGASIGDWHGECPAGATLPRADLSTRFTAGGQVRELSAAVHDGIVARKTVTSGSREGRGKRGDHDRRASREHELKTPRSIAFARCAPRNGLPTTPTRVGEPPTPHICPSTP